MKLLEFLNPTKNRKYSSQEEYKRDVLEAIGILKAIGVSEDSSSDLKSSLESALNKIEEDEEAIYKRKRTKEEIASELKQVNAEIDEIDSKIEELEYRIAMKREQLKFS